jgi:DeoR/GlpR family transcriptional regulator of sugar metabolism
MLGAERSRELRRLLVEQGSVRVSVEARRLGVSEETIRRDIKRLAADGVADPVFGGAVLKSAAPEPRLPSVRERDRFEERAKDAIGLAAARLVEPGQSLVIDAGTTTLAFARRLAGVPRLTVITNSLPVAEACAGLPEGTVYVIGGKLAPGSLSMIGPQAGRELARLRADWAFLGAAAIDPDAGFTSADPYEAEVKRAMIRAARRTVILADRTKFGARHYASFARAADIDRVVTTRGAPAEIEPWLAAAGAGLTLCDPGPGEAAHHGDETA